jgi:exopolysaccharide biosynthesis polyprenyl glycosylphosphotransferase
MPPEAGQAGERPRPLHPVQARAVPTTSADWSDLARRRRQGVVRRRGTLIRRAFVLTDVLALTAAFLIAERMYGIQYPSWDNALSSSSEYIVFAASLPVWLLILKLYGLYGRDEELIDHSSADDVVPVFNAVTVGVWLFMGSAWATRLAQPKFPKLFTFWLAAFALAMAGRIIARQIARRSPGYVQNVVIVGADPSGQLVARKILQHPEYGLNLLGFVDARPPVLDPPLQNVPFLGTAGDLPQLLHGRDVERVIIAGHVPGTTETGLVHELKRSGVYIDVLSRLFDVLGPGVSSYKIEGVLVLGLAPTQHSRLSLAVKRVIDLGLASAILVVTAPLFAWISWRIRRESRGPILFRQTRLGRGMREFTMLKFRTMVVGADQERHRAYVAEIMDREAVPTDTGLYKLERRDEITGFGRWLRKTSLDELPQLLNVLKGEMSLVGPRPCLPYETENFEPHHYERFSVPAGLTGYWQVAARARSTYVEALELDVAYARDWSLGLDLWLLARTPLQMLAKRGTV